MKESLFQRLGDRVEGRRVADVFAGTGTIGLEALSRGAQSVVFFEYDFQAYQLLKENAAALGVLDEVFCWKTDILRCSFRPQKLEKLYPYDFVFCDPPYRMVSEITPRTPFYKAFERLGRPDVTADHASLILRTPDRAEFELPSFWETETVWQMSGMQLHLLRKTAATANSD